MGEIALRNNAARRAEGRRGGFTLLELLVVLVIVGVAWFTLLPNLDLASRYGKKTSALDEYMESVKRTALSEYATQTVSVSINGKLLEWSGRSHVLESPVYRCEVNGESYRPGDCIFNVYRDGFMDQVRLVLLSGEVLEGNALRVEF